MLLCAAGCRHTPGREGAYFVDAAASSGLDFTHTTGADGDYFLIETYGSGGAFFDYDGDGYVDIYLVDGFSLAGLGQDFRPLNLVKQDDENYWVRESYSPPLRFDGQVDSLVYLVHQDSAAQPTRNRLYRNDGDGTFTETTNRTGVGDTGYGMGCAVGDYDNDGDADLYVTNYGPNVLYRNDGDGTFTDVTARTHTGDAHWGTSAAFLDYDGDGYLDLYVVNYLDFTLRNNRICGGVVSPKSRSADALLQVPFSLRTYCAPMRYNGAPDVLYRNMGDGTFRDVTREMNVFSIFGKGLGLATGDFDADGDTDLYVANDGVRNFLYRNDGAAGFQDIALAAGVAYNKTGIPEASMGTDFGDYDSDGDLDLFVTSFSRETYTLYQNIGNGHFEDISEQSGLARKTMLPLGFGTAFFDADNDADLDLFVANGHVEDRVHLMAADLSYPQPNQLFENPSTGPFTDASASSGPAFQAAFVSRGAAFADYDNDGDVDILISNSDGPAELYRNDLSPGRHWLSVRLIGRQTSRDAVGSQVRLTCGGRTQLREVRTSGSYLSANDIRLHFGLGSCDRVEEIEIRWLDGSRQRLHHVPADQFMVVEQP